MVVATGWVPSDPQVQLPKKKGATSYPAIGTAGSPWTHAQRRVIKAYRAVQLALVAASDLQKRNAHARLLLARHMLTADIPVFIAGMTGNWQKGRLWRETGL